MRLEKRFPDKRVLITGANSGFGKAAAIHFGRRGWRVAVTGRRPDAVAAAADEVRRAGAAEVIEIRIDVTAASDFEAAARLVEERWGGVDVVVNNAGIADAGGFEAATLEQWKRVMDVNFWGVVHGCRAFVPLLVRQRRGHILNVASMAGLVSLPEMAVYNAPKAAVVALSETLLVELHGKGVGVTVACPAAFTSDLLTNAPASAGDSVVMQSLARDQQSGRHTAESVAAHAIRSMESNRLYAIAHRDMRVLWFLLRLLPETTYRLVARAYAAKFWRFKPQTA